MELIMLGTGNAFVTECYNTCFVLKENQKCILVDGGGGVSLFRQLKRAGLDWKDMQSIIVTHKHMDHLMGIIWLVRRILQGMCRGEYDREAYIYAHDEVIDIIRSMSDMLFLPKEIAHIDERLHLVTVADGDEVIINDRHITFYDIHSTKTKQFGFVMDMDDDKRLVCCGDEPISDSGRVYAKGAQWLLHEAFCLYEQADIFKPYEKHHSTAKDAAIIAGELNISNLVMYHTEDSNIAKRKQLYTQEAGQYFEGNIYVPDDLEIINL